MNDEFTRIRLAATQARRARDWEVVGSYAGHMMQRWPEEAEGHFLAGLIERLNQQPRKATAAFERALTLDDNRYDAAVELANQYSIARRNGDAARLLDRYGTALDNSPVYLDLAGTVYTEIGLSQKAWPLFRRATALQPGVDLFQANLATCAVFLGKVEEARKIYTSLLKRFPHHRQNHYQLSRLKKARDFQHIEQMKEIIRVNDDPPERAIPLYFAIAKELEDLGQWEESFEYYRKAGDAVCSVANYDVNTDIQLIDSIIENCNADWLNEGAITTDPAIGSKTPIFIIGLPRTGTTLTERIISSHSRVASLGETLFLQMVLRQESGIESKERMTPEMIKAVAGKDIAAIADGYLSSVEYRLGGEPMFIDKLPFNFLYAGFIAKAWPQARIVHLVRNPMDSCFSMFKQVFTWAYKYSYSLNDLARYYLAHDRLRKHWQDLLGKRMVEVEYEALVSDQEAQTRRLLEALELEFEPACLEFDKNKAPSTTASSVQVRAKVHTDSVRRWKRFERQLQPLRDHLEGAGIDIE
jgi:tetratricopeptide (TPR) repeat protein